jgi:hypothetical protein
LSRIGDYRLVASSLGLRIPAWHVLKKLCSVEHVYYLTAPIDRIRFPRLRSDIEFGFATERELVESLRDLSTLDDVSRRDLVVRVLFFRHGFTTCRVGRSKAGQLVSLQWLIRPADNPLLERYLRGRRYLLNDDQVMIENIFVFPPFRGVGVFPTVNHDTISIARQEGFRLCKAYVGKDNIASLNSYFSLGFRIEKLLTGYQLAGHTWGTIGHRQAMAATRAAS